VKFKLSPAIVGAFVIGAFALGLGAVLTLGGINFLKKPQRFLVHFDESIHGLDLGSPVKLRGVRVGRVVNLNIRYDNASNQSVVAVLCEFSKDVMTDPTGAAIDVADRAALERLVGHGLRGRLNVLGLATGLLYIELDFFDPEQYPADPALADPGYLVVPAVPSAIAEFQASASEILASLKQVDFAGLSKGLSALLAETRSQLRGIDLKGVAEQWKKTGAQFESLASGPEVQRTFANLNTAIDDMRATIAKLDAQVEPAGEALTTTLAEARTTISSFRDTATEAQRFIATHAGLGDEIVETFARLNEAADAVQRLADFLERNPNALLMGRKQPK